MIVLFGYKSECFSSSNLSRKSKTYCPKYRKRVSPFLGRFMLAQNAWNLLGAPFFFRKFMETSYIYIFENTSTS